MKNLKNNFVDHVRIYAKSGNGGKGSSHFFRSRNQPKGGPDGGDGGRGGHVIIRGNKNLWTLLHLKYTKSWIEGQFKNLHESYTNLNDWDK